LLEVENRLIFSTFSFCVFS